VNQRLLPVSCGDL